MTLGTSGDYSVQRDRGVSPRFYRGLGLGMHCTLEYRLAVWRFQSTFSVDGNAITASSRPIRSFDLDGVILSIYTHSEAERRLKAHGRWSLWGGLGNGIRWLVGYNSQFSNASVGLGRLYEATLHLRCAWEHGPWMAWGKGVVAPIGVWKRPGYAYVDNYTSGGDEIDNFTGEYQKNATWLPHIAWEAGIERQLGNGNAIGIVYQWDLLTTHQSGCWQYDGVRHGIHFNFRMAF